MSVRFLDIFNRANAVSLYKYKTFTQRTTSVV